MVTKSSKTATEAVISCTFATCHAGQNTRFRPVSFHNSNISGSVTALRRKENTRYDRYICNIHACYGLIHD